MLDFSQRSVIHLYRLFIFKMTTDNTASSQRPLPDPEKCRTRYLGKLLGLTECLVENPDSCEFAVRFSSGVSCFHPERRSFDRADLF